MSTEPLDTRIIRLERLLEVGRKLSATLELEPLLQAILEAAAELTTGQQAAILLVDKDSGELDYAAASWLKKQSINKALVPLNDSLSGQAITHRQAVLVQDLARAGRSFPDFEGRQGEPVQSVLAVPMMANGEPSGVLMVINKLDGAEFTRGDVRVIEPLAAQAAVAIQNAGLLKQAQDAYEELSRLDEMKRDFIAITSHELRTPVGLILGHATFMEASVPEELQEQVKVIVESSLHMKSIIDDLYKANVFQTGMERLRQRPFSLNQLLQEVQRAHQRSAQEKDVELTLKLPKSEVTYNGDNEKIGITLSHLVRNAILFNDPGGKVLVKLSANKQQVRIDVSDTGIGIPPEDLERIFERFYQVEGHMTRRHGGMGLGLSVAKMMVEMHRGRLEVQSQEGKGSTFSVILPRPVEE